MDYLAYHFKVEPPQPGSEILMAFIAPYGFESFEQRSDGFVAYIPDSHAGDAGLSELQFDDFRFEYRVEKIGGSNWNSEWEKNFEPVFVDKLLCIRAPFHKDIHHGCEREIVIMPKMSFGTGHHQTTRLVCREMFGLDLKGKQVLDMGCGTGILAILAMMLGAADVVAIDNDAWSVENARENCADNGFAGIKVLEGSVPLHPAGGKYDLILANINRNILKSQIADYARLLNPSGQLVMSGFFVTDREELRAAAKSHQLREVNAASDGEWSALRFERT